MPAEPLADGITDQARQLLETDNHTGFAKARFLRLMTSPEPGRWRDLTQRLTDLWQDDPWLLLQLMTEFLDSPTPPVIE